MDVNLHNVEVLAPGDFGLLTDCLTRVRQHQHVLSVDLWLNVRAPANHRDYPGWCEYLMNVKYESGGGMTIGCLQRTFGAPTEFHS